MGKRKDTLRRKDSSDDEDDILCPCGKASGSSYWILCDGCETWYHGKCAKFTEKETSMVDKFYCEKCIAKNPSYTTTYKPGFIPKKAAPKETEVKEEAVLNESILKLAAYEPEKLREFQKIAEAQVMAINNKLKSNKRCGNCSGCFRTANCDICTNCYEKKECLRRICVNRSVLVESDTKSSTPIPDESSNQKVIDYIQKQKDTKLLYGKDKVKAKLTNSNDVVHCHGPQCIKQSRPGSKYCSHECGLNRSRARLLLVLPVRVNDYLQEQPVSFLRIQKQIEELLKEQISLDEELAVVSDTRTFFNEYINRLEQQDNKCEKKEKPVKENKRTTENSDEAGAVFSGRCPICGQLSNAYGALQKHIMKCYFRIEKRTCFVGPYAQVQNPENIICDAYCKQQNAYCKRLQVLCFDHYKGFLTAKESVCGAPFAIYENGDIMNMQCPVDKMTILAKGQCAMTKDACDRHHNWGLALLGSLDNYRLTVVRRIEQVKIRIVQLREQYNRRYDVCTLLQNYRITDDTDKYGMPKNVDYVNSVPEYIEKKIEWSEEVAEINKRLQKRLDDRFAAAERKKEEEKAQLEAMKKLKGKNKRPAKKKNPPAKRGRIAGAAAATTAAASSSSTRQVANQENTPMEVDQPQSSSNPREGSSVPPPEVQRNVTNESQLNFSHPSQTSMDIH